jgi:hypothetical protein
MRKFIVIATVLIALLAFVSAARLENLPEDPKYMVLPVRDGKGSVHVFVAGSTTDVDLDSPVESEAPVPPTPTPSIAREADDDDEEDDDNENTNYMADAPRPSETSSSEGEHHRGHPRWAEMCAAHMQQGAAANGQRRPCRWAVFWYCSPAGRIIRHSLTFLGALTVVVGVIRCLRACCRRACRRSGRCTAQASLPVAAAPALVYPGMAYAPPTVPQLFATKA